MKGERKVEHPPQHERLTSMVLLMGGAAGAWLVAIWLGAQAKPVLGPVAASAQGQVGVLDFALSIAIAAAILIFLRRHRAFGVFVALTLAFLGFSGATLLAGPEIGFFVSAGVLLYERLRRTYVSNNLLILYAAAFGALPVALGYPVDILVIFLVLISVYDVLGVFVTGFIPKLAREAVDLDVPLLLLAPRRGVKWNETPHLFDAAAMLGAGDVFVPALFLASVAFHASAATALVVFIGAAAGALANVGFAALVRGGIPAMPLLSAGMLAAYALTR